MRTPQLLVISTVTGAMFLLIFRYVFGGAIDAGPVSYVDFMVPGYIVTSVLFTGSNASSSVAAGPGGGLHRPAAVAARVPHRGARRPGRRRDRPAGPRPGGHRRHRLRRRLPPRRARSVEALAAFGLTLVFGFAFMWVFVWLGLVAGNVQAAQGMSLLIFPLSFVSSAMVPVDSMPGWLQPVAENQPITVMTNAVRSLALGDPSLAGLGGIDRPLRDAGAGVVGRAGRGVRPAGGAAVPQVLTLTGGGGQANGRSSDQMTCTSRARISHPGPRRA